MLYILGGKLEITRRQQSTCHTITPESWLIQYTNPYIVETAVPILLKTHLHHSLTRTLLITLTGSFGMQPIVTWYDQHSLPVAIMHNIFLHYRHFIVAFRSIRFTLLHQMHLVCFFDLSNTCVCMMFTTDTDVYVNKEHVRKGGLLDLTWVFSYLFSRALSFLMLIYLQTD